MKYRFSCPNCGHGQESSFVRLGARVLCPSCNERFRIETETLEGGAGGSLGPGAAKQSSDGTGSGGEADSARDSEPDALVGLSGLSGLMHEAEELLEKNAGSDSSFPGQRNAAGSFRGAAEAGVGVGVDGVSGGSLDDDDEVPAFKTPAAPQPLPVQPPPTRDQLRKKRLSEREQAAERLARRRRLWLQAGAAGAVVVVAVLLGLALWVLLGGSNDPQDVEAPQPAAPVVGATSAASSTAPVSPPRTHYARSVALAAPTPVPETLATAAAVPDLLGQTRRLEVTFAAGAQPVPGPLTLHFQADALAWEARLPRGLAAGETREVTVLLVPPLPTPVADWSVTVTR